MQFRDLYRSNRDNFRYFKTPYYQKGNIFYRGQDYYNINMKYDLVEDQVIVSSSGKLNFLDIRLIQEKVQNFEYNNLYFVFYNANKNMAKGFYEEAFKDEDLVFLVKYSKDPNRKIGNNSVYFTFKEKQSFYLKRGDFVKNISNLRDVKRFFKEKDETIESFIKFNPQNNTENFRSYMIRLLEYLKRNQ